MIKMMLIAGLGGFFGTCLRFLVGRLLVSELPLATFTVNIVGCFIIGLVFGLMERTQIISGEAGVLLAVGFCGGFTTFSSLANELWLMAANGRWLMAALYLAASVLAGVLLVWAGRALVR
ncbi:MAG: fluoride efflux transporter CrcB [Muribaculaceae bacterium]|nr:fluoride efflux transporter CrcB [Muribaculaceae bacterium]